MHYTFDIDYELIEYGDIDVVEYYVVAIDEATGRVLRHQIGFRSHDLFIDPQTDEEHIIARRAGDAEREARLLLSRVRQRGSISPSWWYELVPAGVDA